MAYDPCLVLMGSEEEVDYDEEASFEDDEEASFEDIEDY